jgi:hypothetical protein
MCAKIRINSSCNWILLSAARIVGKLFCFSIADADLVGHQMHASIVLIRRNSIQATAAYGSNIRY